MANRKLTQRQISILIALKYEESIAIAYYDQFKTTKGLGALTPCITKSVKPYLYPNAGPKTLAGLMALERRGLARADRLSYKSTLRWHITPAGTEAIEAATK